MQEEVRGVGLGIVGGVGGTGGGVVPPHPAAHGADHHRVPHWIPLSLKSSVSVSKYI